MTITPVLPSVLRSTTSKSTAAPSAEEAIAAIAPSNQRVRLNSETRARTSSISAT